MKAIVYMWKDNIYKEIAEIDGTLIVRGEDKYTGVIEDWIEQQDEILAIKVLPKLVKEFSNGYVEAQIINGD